MHECHDSPLGGHFGREKTAALVRRVAFWPGLSDEVREYVRSCSICQKVKADHGGPHGLLHPLPLPTRRGGTLGVDWICGLPVTAAGFDQLMVIVDLLSGKVHATPSKSTDNAATAAQTLLDHSLRSGDGVPDVLVVDHDPKFTSQLFREFTKAIGSALIVGTAYHKNTGSRVERANGVLGDTLRALANSRRDDWDKWVLHACFAINNAPSSLGGHLSPFFIDRGAHPRLPLSLPNLSEAQETPEAYSRRVKLLEEEVRRLLHAAQAERKAKLDPGRVDVKFAPGDLVLVRSKELLDAADIGKLRDRWEGPFKVIKEAAPNAYLLKVAKRFRFDPTVNVDRLRPYVVRAGAPAQPGPIPGAAHDVYEAEAVLNHKLIGPSRRVHYLVHWRGYPSSEDTWEPAEHLRGCVLVAE